MYETRIALAAIVKQRLYDPRSLLVTGDKAQEFPDAGFQVIGGLVAPRPPEKFHVGDKDPIKIRPGRPFPQLESLDLLAERSVGRRDGVGSRLRFDQAKLLVHAFGSASHGLADRKQTAEPGNLIHCRGRAVLDPQGLGEQFEHLADTPGMVD